MEENFLISILLKAIDDASPTIAKVAAEIKALKEAAGGDVRVRSEPSPTAQLAKDITAAGAAADRTEREVSDLRKEFEATGKSVRSVARDIDGATQSTEKAADAQDDLSKRMDAVAGKVQKQLDLYRQMGSMGPGQERWLTEWSRQLEKAAQALNDDSDAYQRYIDLSRQASQAIIDERVARAQFFDVQRQVTDARVADMRGMKDSAEAMRHLEERAAELDEVYRKLADDFSRQTELTKEQQIEAEKLVKEYTRLANAYDITDAEQRAYFHEYMAMAKEIKGLQEESARNAQQHVDQLLANARAAHEVRQQEQRDIEAELKRIEAEGKAREELGRRVSDLSTKYEDFTQRMERGNVEIDQAVTGYKQMQSALMGLSRQFDPASEEAIRFAEAAKRAGDEGARLMAFTGGGGRGGSFTGTEARNLAWGPGSRGLWTLGLPLASMGTLGALGGLGPEHFLMTLLGIGGSAVGGLAGGGLLGAASLGTTAV